MDCETQIERQPRAAPSRPDAINRGWSALPRDLVALAELQMALLGEDGKDAAKHGRLAVAMLLASLLLAVASLPVMVLGLGHLVAMTGMPLGVAMLLIAGLTLAACLAAAVLAWRRLRGATGAFRRSANELQANIAWLKTSLNSAAAWNSKDSDNRATPGERRS